MNSSFEDGSSKDVYICFFLCKSNISDLIILF